jgi:hypothetical protein
MNQPVSNNSFKARHGYLGVFLHEGGPLTDALWNESGDIQWNAVRWLARDAGLVGSTGPELQVVCAEDANGDQILVIKGGPGRFYCDGLPVLWPADRPIDAQVECCEPLLTDCHGVAPQQGAPDCHQGRWTDWLRQEVLYYVYLDVWVDTVDALERPFLDDPGICREPGRGSFRKVVRSCVRVAEEGVPPLGQTNLELTIQGTYQSDRNVFYAVELVGLAEDDGGRPCARLLWDDAGGAVVSEVTQPAAQDTHSVELRSPRGFEVGHRVRFDGCGISDTIYRVTGLDGGRITICRDAASVAPRSLAGCEVVAWEKDPELPVAYKLTVKAGCPPQEAPIREGDLVIDVPAITDVPASDAQQHVWRVWKIACCDDMRADSESPCCDKSRITYSLILDGFADALEPWDSARSARLVATAHPFSYCVVVEDRPDWTEGMRVLISANDPPLPEEASEQDVSAGAELAEEPCLPGQGRIRSPESRTITKIVRCSRPVPGDDGEENGEAVPVMIVRLDEPLSYEHTAGIDIVTPARVLRAQRFAGHEHGVHIGGVSSCNDSADGPCCLSGPLKLPSGLELFLTTPFTGDGEVVPPAVVPGDGWRFAARGSGWVDRLVFAPVEPRYRCRTLLATFAWSPDGQFTDVEDRRPLPRGCHEDVYRTAIRHACRTIARRFPDERIGQAAEAIHRDLAQQRLTPYLPRLTVLCEVPRRAAGDHAGCKEAFAELRQAVDAASRRVPRAPSDTELEAVAEAVTSLSDAVWSARTHAVATRPAAEAPPGPVASEQGAGEAHSSPISREAAPRESVSSEDGDTRRADAAEASGAVEDEPQDLGAIPLAALRALDEVKSEVSRERLIEKWPTLADCRRHREAPRGHNQERILAVVQELAQRTAAITSRIGVAGTRRDSLLAELEALWDGTVRLEGLRRRLSLADAARFADDWALARDDS